VQLQDLPTLDEPPWSWKKAALSLPYSEREEWRKVLEYQALVERSNLQGPPGLLEEMASQSPTVLPLKP